MVACVESALLKYGPVHPGEQVILVASLPMALQGAAEFFILHTVGNR